MNLNQVADSPKLAREADSKAILNTDVNALEAYKQRRLRERKQSQIIAEWDTFIHEISEIKEMLKEILCKLEKIENR